MANALHLAGLVGLTSTADDFSTDTVSQLGIPGQEGAAPVTFSTWLDDSGQPWDSGGLATPLSYAVTAVSDPNQVVTFQISGASGEPFTLYGQVVNWNAHTLLFQGFLAFDPSTGALSDPMPGPSSFFVLSDHSLEATQGVAGPASFSTSGPVPFFLQEFNQVSCFARGTAIMTPSGPVPVEALAAGDAVLTASGAPRPIQWIGCSQIRCDRHRNPGRVMPVRIQQHAFGAGLPVRDLVLSPEHAVYHDGVMIPVHCLVNGTTIRQVSVESAAYYHIELPHHDVLLAEGLPAESYLDTGARHAMTPLDVKTHAA